MGCLFNAQSRFPIRRRMLANQHHLKMIPDLNVHQSISRTGPTANLYESRNRQDVYVMNPRGRRAYGGGIFDLLGNHRNGPFLNSQIIHQALAFVL